MLQEKLEKIEALCRELLVLGQEMVALESPEMERVGQFIEAREMIIEQLAGECQLSMGEKYRLSHLEPEKEADLAAAYQAAKACQRQVISLDQAINLKMRKLSKDSGEQIKKIVTNKAIASYGYMFNASGIDSGTRFNRLR